MEVEKEAADLGIDSAYVHWAKAICLDYALNLLDAWNEISTAMKIDPLNPAIEHSFNIIAGRIRMSIAINPTDDATEKLFNLLRRASKCDETSFVAMGKFLLHNNRGDEALNLLTAVTTTSPSFRDAWTMKAIIAKKLGKEELAAEASAEALALGADSPVLFGSCDVEAAA